jgi:hypothetical protein
MSVLYTVRCRFNDPEREAEWNEWYAGHLDVLMGVPGFLAAQRFHSDSTVDDRPYLAMYEVASPDVFRSEAYQAIWGFDDWRPLIDNWTRDLFDPAGGRAVFATGAGAHLRAGFITGQAEAVGEALAELASLRETVGTGRVSGLDRSCDGIAWEAHDGSAQRWPSTLAAVQIAAAAYEPITEHRSASTDGALAR